MSSFDVVGFGGLNVDKLFRVNKIAAAEEESFVADYTETCGGSAANTIVGLARLGRRTGFIGKVADDVEGKMLTREFRGEGVDTAGIIITKHGTSGKVLGFVDKKGQRALYVDPGVNDTIDFDEINKQYASQTKYLHLTSFVGETSFKAQKKLVRTLSHNVKLSFDPGTLYARMGLAALEPIVKETFVFMPNSNELELLTEKTDYKKGAEVLLTKNVQVVAVKLGSKGCYVTNGHERYSIPTLKVDVVDTTGAGDAFCAGFLYGLVKGKNLYECGRIGNFVASRCIMKMGARPGLPTLSDLVKNKLA